MKKVMSICLFFSFLSVSSYAFPEDAVEVKKSEAKIYCKSYCISKIGDSFGAMMDQNRKVTTGGLDKLQKSMVGGIGFTYDDLLTECDAQIKKRKNYRDGDVGLLVQISKLDGALVAQNVGDACFSL